MTSCDLSTTLGSIPYRPRVQIVRGDTFSIRIEFYEEDGLTLKDISQWTFVSTAYDAKTDMDYELTVTPDDGYVDITAEPNITNAWGNGNTSISAELQFDLEVTMDMGTVWTPVIGSIVVLSDTTLGGML